MGATAIGVTEKEDEEQRVDEEHIFYRMVFFLAAITRGLFNRVLGAAGAAVGTATTGAGSSSNGVSTVAAAASETPRRWAKADRERAGASPRARSAASNAGSRTWIH